MPTKPVRLMSALALLVPLSGCSKTLVVTADELCQSWRHQRISKDDRLTQGTAEQIEGSNNARPAWGCEPGADRAKS